MFAIVKAYEFSAGHCLDHLPDGHPCARPHGHNYTVEVEVTATKLNADSMVIDFKELDQTVGAWIKAKLDHRDLNPIMTPFRTTSEQMAQWIYDRLSSEFAIDIAAIRVSETGKTWAEWRP